MQKRSADKDSFPGVYDVSSAGHLPAGEDFRKSAVRELKEELGISAGLSSFPLSAGKGRKFTRSFTAGPGITMNSAPSTRCILTGSRIRCGFRRARWKPFSGQTMRPVWKSCGTAAFQTAYPSKNFRCLEVFCMGKETKTNAMRILERNKIPYELIQYECDEFIDGLHTAEKTGLRWSSPLKPW